MLTGFRRLIQFRTLVLAMAASSTADKIRNVYRDGSHPEDQISTIRHSADKPDIPEKPSFGLDSVAGLIYSNVLAPLYLYTSFRGKFAVWDEILEKIPDSSFYAPTLDVGCGRGMVLLKIASLKKKLASSPSASTDAPTAETVQPAYGIDIFSKFDQTGNSPTATYKNAASMDVLDYTVLHNVSFAEPLPFADGVFSLVTASLAIHNADKEGRTTAVKEMARVCAVGGKIVIVDLPGFFHNHTTVLKELGWTDVKVKLAGVKMMWGMLPSSILTATKPGGRP